jgi:hypothetical protein
MPEWWPWLLIGGLGVFLLLGLSGGLAELIKEVRQRGGRKLAFCLLSPLQTPAMFSSYAAANHCGDPERDALGFEYPDHEHGSGFITRSEHRMRLIENRFTYITCAHGIVSIFLAVAAGLPFLWCMHKFVDGYYFPKSYGAVGFILGLAFFVVYARTAA